MAAGVHAPPACVSIDIYGSSLGTYRSGLGSPVYGPRSGGGANSGVGATGRVNALTMRFLRRPITCTSRHSPAFSRVATEFWIAAGVTRSISYRSCTVIGVSLRA